MEINIVYLLVAVGGMVLGLLLGYFIGKFMEKHRTMRRLALTIDGEMHQALHYMVADEEKERTDKHRRTDKGRPAPKMGDVTPANSQARRAVNR